MRRLVIALGILSFIGTVLAGGTATLNDPSLAYYKIDVTWPPLPVVPVNVMNWPAEQVISGIVNVGNLPAVQEVGGTVNVGNLPAIQTVAGNVAVSNLPLDAGGALRVTVPAAKFVGVTTAVLSADAGWRNLNLACHSQFGASYPTARFCTSKEILTTPVAQWPSLPGIAWVQPVIVSAAVSATDPPLGGFMDASGVSDTNPQSLACNGWSSKYSSRGFPLSGLVLGGNGGFGQWPCTDPNTFVTCCADTTP